MALEKQIRVEQVEVVDVNATITVQVKEIVEIVEEGLVISTNNHRYSIQSGQDYSFAPEIVRKICDAVL